MLTSAFLVAGAALIMLAFGHAKYVTVKRHGTKSNLQKAIAKMEASVDRASKDGRTETLFSQILSRNPAAASQPSTWTKDLIAYCERLGLSIRTQAVEDTSSKHRSTTWRIEIFASWATNVHEEKPNEQPQRKS